MLKLTAIVRWKRANRLLAKLTSWSAKGFRGSFERLGGHIATVGLSLRRPSEPASLFAGNGGQMPAGPLDDLTPREREVLTLIAPQHCSNREIAGLLVIQEATVEWHVHRILAKLGVRTRNEAARTYLTLDEKPMPSMGDSSHPVS